MTSAYYSTIFAAPAAEVWKIVRDFNNYPVWVDGAGDSEIEDGKTGDTVGAVRSVHYNGRHIRQRLLALSDVERSQTILTAVPLTIEELTTLCTIGGVGRLRRTMRAVLATSWADAAIFAPRAASGLVTSAFVSNTQSAKPASSSREAMCPPMRPTPTNPIS